MKLKIISMTKNPIDVIASAYAITRGITYEEFLKKYSDKGKKDLIKKGFESGHLTPFEKVDIDVEATGFSRVFETQKVRTRHASYSIQSGRLLEKDFILVKPNSVSEEEHAKAQQEAFNLYEKLLKNVDPEDARYYLPQGLKRMGRFKQNLRSWIETSMLRLCLNTQWEYRDFMSKLKREINQYEPFLSEFLQPQCNVYGYCIEKFNSCKKFSSKDDVLKGKINFGKIYEKSQEPLPEKEEK